MVSGEMSHKYPGGWVTFSSKDTPIASELEGYLKPGNWDIVSRRLSDKKYDSGAYRSVMEQIVRHFSNLTLYELPPMARKVVEQIRGCWREHMGR